MEHEGPSAAPSSDGVSREDEHTALEREVRAQMEPGRGAYEEYVRLTGDDWCTFDEVVETRVRSARADYQKGRARAELEGDSVVWGPVDTKDIEAFKQLLGRGVHEEPVHRFLDDHPEFLGQTLAGGHGRYHLSKKKLGAELIPDFLIAHAHSFGVEWHAVELESPEARPYRKDGLQSSKLTHAIGQLRDWRAWLASNRDYARRAREENGLGLTGIDSQVAGLVLIGRREEFPERFNELRRQLRDDDRIVVHSYDWLVEVAQSSRGGSLSFELRGDISLGE